MDSAEFGPKFQGLFVDQLDEAATCKDLDWYHVWQLVLTKIDREKGKHL